MNRPRQPRRRSLASLRSVAQRTIHRQMNKGSATSPTSAPKARCVPPANAGLPTANELKLRLRISQRVLERLNRHSHLPRLCLPSLKTFPGKVLMEENLLYSMDLLDTACRLMELLFRCSKIRDNYIRKTRALNARLRSAPVSAVSRKHGKRRCKPRPLSRTPEYLGTDNAHLS